MLKKLFATTALCLAAFATAANADTAVFAGGCFWSMQKAFDHVAGVTNTVAGFMGGHVKNPSYREVTGEQTGHVEAVQVTYDPAKVTYQQLLDTYWHHTDPTNPDGVICDFGSSYHTAIFTYSDDQYAAANASKVAVGKQLNAPIYTLVVKSTGTGLPFYPAEAYHQHYWKTHELAYDAYAAGCGRSPALHKIWGNLAD